MLQTLLLLLLFSVAGTFTLRKLECLKQVLRLNNVAWNNRIGPRFYFVGFVEHCRFIGTDIRIAVLEVKLLERCKTNNCESICQECFH